MKQGVTKTDMVKNHLRKFGEITSLEAIESYGATRLSSIIYDLRAQGMDIVTERIPMIDRYGNEGHYGRYVYRKKTVDE